MNRTVTVTIEGKPYIVEVGDLGERPVRATVNGRTIFVEIPGEAGQPPAGDSETPLTARSAPATPPPAARPTPAAAPPAATVSAVTAPMPGDIAEIRVRPGDRVAIGEVLCVLEAMKMKNLIHSPRAGTIATVAVTPGQAVEYDTVLVTFS